MQELAADVEHLAVGQSSISSILVSTARRSPPATAERAARPVWLLRADRTDAGKRQRRPTCPVRAVVRAMIWPAAVTVVLLSPRPSREPGMSGACSLSLGRSRPGSGRLAWRQRFRPAHDGLSRQPGRPSRRMRGRRRPAREVNRAEYGLTSASRPTSKGAPPGWLGQKRSLAAVVRMARTSISARLASTIDLLGILDSAAPDEICPGAVVRSARWWPWDLPGGGHRRPHPPGAARRQ